MASVRWIVRSTLVALLAPLMGLSVQAQAQPVLESPIFAGRELHIDGLDVEEVPLLVSGTSLNFTLFGSSGAAASLQIDGARRALPLRETGRGVYEGTYTIDDRERIAPNARVVATLRRGTEVATSVLDEPLVLGAPAPQATSRQAASGDPVLPRRSTAPGGSAAEPHRTPPSGRVPAALARACSDCAVVESIRRVETGPGGDGVAGAIVGGLLGMILGNQVAGHDTRPVARLVGAVGGALAGRAIERSQGRTAHYDVLLRRPDGSSQVHRYDGVPPLRVGETVRLPAVTYAQTSRLQSRYAGD